MRRQKVLLFTSKKNTVTAILFLWLQVCCSTANEHRSPQTEPVISVDNATRQIFSATNEQRRDRRLAALAQEERLMTAAKAYAVLMAKEDKLSHTVGGNQLADRIARVQYSWKTIGENIANNSLLKGEDVVLQQWMRSTPHRLNILNKDFTHIGIGIAGPSRSNRYYYCQIFARPK